MCLLFHMRKYNNPSIIILTKNYIKEKIESAFAHHLDDVDDCPIYPNASAESPLKILKVTPIKRSPP